MGTTYADDLRFLARVRDAERQARVDRLRRAARIGSNLVVAAVLLAGGLVVYDRVAWPALQRAESTIRDATWGSTICAVSADANASIAANLARQDAQLRAAGLLDDGEHLADLDTARTDALCGDD